MRVTALVLAWLASRAVLVWLLLGPQAWVGGDVGYYAASLDLVGEAGLSGTLPEYPLPAVGVVAVPWALAGLLGAPDRYAVLLVAVAVLTDLAFTVALWATSRQRSLVPVAAWLLVVPLLGSTTFARFDLLPGVLCGLAVLLLARRPGPASVLAAVATAVKLWPVLVLPALLGPAGARRRVLLGIVLTGGVLAGASVLLGGFDRLLSPLTYQADRGLQIESVPATPVMVAWALDPDAWVVAYAPSKSFEIGGPAVALMLSAATLATLLYLCAMAAAWWRLVTVARSRQRGVDLPTVVWLVLASVVGFIVTGKVLSPQYLLWVAPVAAAGLVVADGPALRRWTALLLLAAGLTQLVFPTGYAALTAGSGSAVPVVAALALRNLVMIALLVLAARQAWRRLAAAQPRIALERQPSGPGRSGDRTAR